jgi:hypothetical protein
MRLIGGLIKTVLILIGLVFITVVTTVLFAFGGIIYLLGGRRRPTFRVYSFRSNLRDYPEGFERPPMKDVTPRPAAHLESAQES